MQDKPLFDVASRLRLGGPLPLIAILSGAIILLLPAIANGFPFIFHDTPDYLIFTPRLYRSCYYGVFAFMAHLNSFIWMPIVAQAIIVSHLIWTWVRFYNPRNGIAFFLAVIVLLTALSSLPLFVDCLMPDIFTSILILVTALLAFQWTRLSVIERIYFFLLLCVSIAVHLSHFPFSLALLASVALIFLLQRRPRAEVLPPLGAISAAVLLAAAAIMLNNGMVHRTISLSPAGPSFLLANLIEQGPAREYLKEVCPGAGYKICADVERLPSTADAFLWRGTFERLGGFAGMREEAGQIVAETIRTRPGAVAAAGMKSVVDAVSTRAPGAELHPIAENTAPLLFVLGVKFGQQAVDAYEASAQARDVVPRQLLKTIDMVVFPMSSVFVVGAWLLSWRDRRSVTFSLGAMVLAGIVANLLLCALVSGVHDRYQARVTWLLPFMVLLVCSPAFDAAYTRALRMLESLRRRHIENSV